MTPLPKIRLIAVDEVQHLVEMGEMFFRESKLPGTWNPDHFVTAWKHGIAAGYMFCVVVEQDGKFVAAIGATLGVCANTGDIMCGENFWFSKPEFRGRAKPLLMAYEFEAKKRGAKRIYMMCLESLRPEVLGKLYQRLGYKPVERCFWKGI